MDRYFEDMLPAEEQAQLGFIPTIPEFVSWIEQKWHDLPALSDTVHVRTYAQMCDNIAHKRALLASLGLQRADKLKEPSILVINHTSHLDGPVVNTVFRRDHIHNLAAKDRFEQRGFGFFLRHTRCIPIDRQNPDLSWIHESLRVLHEEKEHVAIFLEGAHGKHREQLPFHSGVVMLAALAGVPIVMIYIDGPHKILRKRSKLIVAPPFRLDPPTEGLNSYYVNAQTEALQSKMKELMAAFIKIDEEEA